MSSGICDLIWGENPDTSGPFGIDYAYLYECSSSSLNPLVVLLYFVWIFYLITLLAQTASNYLSPTLSKICEKLNVAYDVAGVTFLAFGNGAPDFFSLIASFSGGVDILVGVGALLGGSMFVCTVVVGSIAILSPCDVSKRIFLRDISFHLIAIVSVSIIALIGRVYFPMVIVLYAMYIAYVLMVVISSSRDAANHAHQLAKQRYLRKKQKTISVEEMEIQTAFWHIESTTAASIYKNHASANAANSSITMKRNLPLASAASSLSSSSTTSTSPFASISSSAASSLGSTSGGASGGGGYSFLLLSTKEEMEKQKRSDQARRGDDDDDDDEDGQTNTTAADKEFKEKSKQDKEDDEEKHDPYYHKKRITISGGAPLDWDRIVVENYYSIDNNSSSGSAARGNNRIMVGEESAGGINSVNRSTKSSINNNANTFGNTRKSSPSAAATTFTIADDDEDEENDSRSSRMSQLSGDHGEGVRLIDFRDKKVNNGRKKNKVSSFFSGGEGLEASLLANEDPLDNEEEGGDEDDVEEIEFTLNNNNENMNNDSSGANYNYFDYRRLIPRSDGPNAWKLQTMYGSSVLTAMYWQQWTLRRSLRHRLVDDWKRARSVWDKAWVIIEAPASLARDVTIPTLEEAQWSKMIAMMHPIASPMFALWILGFFASPSAPSTTARHLLAVSSNSISFASFFTTLSVWRQQLASVKLTSLAVKIGTTVFLALQTIINTVHASTQDKSTTTTAAAEPSLSGFEIFLLIVFSGGASLFIFLSTNTSRPPHSWLFAGVWALSAFVMCILWIYALAGELITILSVLGEELRLPPAFLGLTVLAWGNSIGDFFTNTAVAKQGYGTMALAGCYGGPVFNLLIGFGSSLLYATIQAYTVNHAHYYEVSLDASSWISLVFIIVALSSTMVIVMLRNYRMDRIFGIYLIMLYAIYSVVQAILVMVERSK